MVMKKSNLWTAILAITLVFGMTAVGCDDGGGDSKTLSGNVKISPSTSVVVGMELTAAYSGNEQVTYQWNRGGNAVQGAATNKHTPTEEGDYTVTVSAAGYKSKTSTPVTVTALARVVNTAAIAGVTAPVLGKTPVTGITENEQYSGTITWSGNPSVFGASTAYTATITLTAKPGYTFQGVAENFFTVAGATTVSNSVNSGDVNAGFPATDALPPPIEMVNVPGGSFDMGKNLGTGGGADETPVHTVTLTGFSIGKYEVTQAQYKAVTGNNPSNQSSNPADGEVQEKRPVEFVNWYDAIVFCNRLSMIEGLIPAYSINGSTDPDVWGTPPAPDSTLPNAKWDAVIVVSGSTGYRLPTEAQWEYAAKGGNPSAAGWVAYTYSGSDTLGDVAWYNGNAGGKTHEVGKKLPNSLGLYDMSGNVMEWCWDWNGNYTDAAQNDPSGPAAAAGVVNRTRRGGNWNSGPAAVELRSAGRGSRETNVRGSAVGFRVVRPLM